MYPPVTDIATYRLSKPRFRFSENVACTGSWLRLGVIWVLQGCYRAGASGELQKRSRDITEMISEVLQNSYRVAEPSPATSRTDTDRHLWGSIKDHLTV